jgi:hypothetical protein
MTKKQFRHTKAWKEFRAKVLKDSDYTCKICGRKRPAKTLDLHHIKDEYYEVPRLESVAVLCSLCHRYISAIERMKVKPDTEYLRAMIEHFIWEETDGDNTHPGSVTGNISKGPKTNPETENPKSPIEKMDVKAQEIRDKIIANGADWTEREANLHKAEFEAWKKQKKWEETDG